MRICIDPGHGGSDPGACANGLQEKDIALAVSFLVRDYLVAAGCEVVMTRESDMDVSYPNSDATTELQARCNVSDNFAADIFVSIHCNAAGSDQALGTETYYYAASSRGRLLAAYIQQQIVGSLGTVDRGIKSSPLYVTGHIQAVAALAELAFISNLDDAALLGDPAKRDEFARAISRGITDFISDCG